MNKNSVLLFVISISLISAGCQHGSGFSPGKAGVIAGAAIGAVTGYVVSDQ